MVSHKHVMVNGVVTNIASYWLRPGDKVAVSPKSGMKDFVKETMSARGSRFSWLEHNTENLEGTFVGYPEREQIPENVREQLVVELYSK
jgi:small subunit ribosomal protein S4